ncbi:ABC transporter substrate-binding protein [Sporomusa ovata]|uniref:ABC transporter substrate-binding protein n=1 Tax=Sporomusa ovata TaxID=2378 RepID=UPI0030D5FDA7
MKVSVAAQNNSGQVFQYMAEARDFLKEEGIDVNMVYINNGTDAFTALAGGKVDVISTYGTGGPLIQIANGQDFTVFGGYMIIGETPCFGKPETEWKNLESFRGKKIGITRGGTPDIVLKGILYDAGLLNSVTFVEYKKNQEVLQAIVSGEVDFGATATGYELQAAALGLKVKMWPDEYWPNHSCCRMLATGAWMKDEKNQEALYRLLRAYLRAEEAMQGNMDEVVDLVVKKLDLDKATVTSFVKSEHMKYDSDPYKNSVVKMWNKMGNFGYIKDSNVKIEDHINTKIYKKALDSLIKDYPNSQFFKDKLVQFNQNNA